MDNFSVYSKESWIGLTKSEVSKKVTKLFGKSVRYTFGSSERETEKYYLNFITFIVDGDIVINSYWG